MFQVVDNTDCRFVTDAFTIMRKISSPPTVEILYYEWILDLIENFLYINTILSYNYYVPFIDVV